MGKANQALKKLADAGLFGQGLVPVTSPELVTRYNDCLTRLGIEPTKLTAFFVDGMGWSPEIADEKGDTYYLSAGEANPMAIIVSPNQAKKPIYNPYNSYDRELMRILFERFSREIADVTISCHIGVDIDQELTGYTQPSDLLDVIDVVVRSDVGMLGKIAGKQRKLADQFLKDEMTWFDPAARAKIIELSKPHGDLRYRQVVIPDLQFRDVKCFHTKAFGGVFVFRTSGKKPKSLLVLENGEVPHDSQDNIIGLEDKQKLLKALVDAGLAEVNLNWYSKNIAEMEQLREYFIADLVCTAKPDMDFLGSSSAKVKKILSGLEPPPYFFELERTIKKMEKGQTPKADKLSLGLRLMLLRPKARLPKSTTQVVQQLLVRLNPLDVLQLYTADKNYFFQQYLQWGTAKQNWAIDYIVQRYQPVMNQ